MKRAALVYVRPEADRPDALDALAQAEVVRQAMRELGWECRDLPLDDAPDAGRKWFRSLEACDPELVFNLVEGYGRDPRRQAAAAALLELGGWACTGASSAALLATTDKILTKSLLQTRGLATPEWQVYDGQPDEAVFPPPWIVKPAWEDASVGVDDQAVILNDEQRRQALRERFARHHGQPLLVEAFISGREFHVSLLEAAGGEAEVLPPAETLFTDWPEGKPRIVNYRAKWDAQAFEYHHTPRNFALPADLSGELGRLAQACWRVFSLRGYARVDLRQDAGGRLYVIEINANPCLAPEAGFLAAAARAGYAPLAVVKRIVAAAQRPSGKG